MSARLPFRTEPYVADADRLEAARAETGIAFSAAEELLNSPDRVEALLTDGDPELYQHPDERVLLEAVGHSDWRLRNRRRHLPIWERAVAEAEAQGWAWTPLLDAMAGATGAWPFPSDFPEPRPEWDDLRKTRFLQGAADWMRTRERAEDYEPFLTFQSEPARFFLAEHAGAVDQGLVERLVTGHPGRAVELFTALGKNDAMPDSVFDSLVGEMTAAFDPDLEPSLETHRDHERASRFFAGVAEGERGLKLEQVDALIDQVHSQTVGDLGRVLMRLGDLVRPDPLRRAYHAAGARAKHLLAHPSADVKLWRWALDDAAGHDLFEIRQLVSEIPQAVADDEVRARLLKTTSWEVLTELADHDNPVVRDDAMDRLLRTHLFEVAGKLVGPDAETARWVKEFSGPRLDDVVDAALAASEPLRILQQLAERAPGARHPRVQAGIIDHPNSRTIDLLRVARHVRGERFRALFRRLPHRYAFRVLDDQDWPGLSDLEPEDLGPLLSHSSREVRTRAIGALAELRTAEEDVPSEGRTR